MNMMMVLIALGLIIFFVRNLFPLLSHMSMLFILAVFSLISSLCSSLSKLISFLFQLSHLYPQNSFNIYIDWSRVTTLDIEKHCSMVSYRLSPLSSEILDCTLPDCSSHHNVLESFGLHLVSTLLTCAIDCFLTRSVSSTRRNLELFSA